MAENSDLIKTKDRGAGEAWTREQGFLFCFSQFCHIENWGIFPQKIAKLLEFTPTLLSPQNFHFSKWRKPQFVRGKHTGGNSAVFGFFGRIHHIENLLKFSKILA